MSRGNAATVLDPRAVPSRLTTARCRSQLTVDRSHAAQSLLRFCLRQRPAELLISSSECCIDRPATGEKNLAVRFVAGAASLGGGSYHTCAYVAQRAWLSLRWWWVQHADDVILPRDHAALREIGVLEQLIAHAAVVDVNDPKEGPGPSHRHDVVEAVARLVRRASYGNPHGSRSPLRVGALGAGGSQRDRHRARIGR